MSIPFHPLADLFPPIEGAEFDDLVASVREHGLRHNDGMLRYGANSIKAANAAKSGKRIERLRWSRQGDKPEPFPVLEI